MRCGNSAKSPTWTAVLLLGILGFSVTACAGSTEPPETSDVPATPASGTGYTSDQLRQALLLEIPGYQRAGEPDSGEYGSLSAIQNFNQLQRQVKLDKPRCATVGREFGLTQGAAPTAIATFTKGNGQTVTETLIRVSPDTANRQVRLRVPVGCRVFRARVGDQWSEHHVVEARGRLGAGSRTVGVATTSGASHVKTWYVVLKAPGYLATITLYGPNVTRAEAEQIARQAYDQAERILP
jgi:hypothetical protein